MNIDNVIARAQRMMLDENFNAQVEMGAAAHRAGSVTGRKNTGNDLAAFEAQAFGSVQSPTVNAYTPIPESAKQQRNTSMIRDDGRPIQMLSETYEPRNLSNSKLPKSIIESFSEMPPLSGDDDYSTPPASYFANNSVPAAPKQIVTEQQYVPQPQQIAGIDYNALKYIINECIKENMKTLNESVSVNEFRGMRLKEGGVIQFIDTKGNLFEGKLVLKKKAK